MQYDDGIEQDKNGKVIKINGKPVENDKLYSTTLSLWDIQEGFRVISNNVQYLSYLNIIKYNFLLPNPGSSRTLKEYFAQRPDEVPTKDACWPVYSSLISFFARNMWKTVRSLIDTDGDGKISRQEVRFPQKWEKKGELTFFKIYFYLFLFIFIYF